MNKLLLSASIAMACTLPLSVGAAGDKAASPTSGAEKMFQALDKNKDGFLSREEARGTPHDKDFATLDKNRDGKLSREEHAAAPEHAGEMAASGRTGATGGSPMTSGAAGGSAAGASPGAASGTAGSQGKAAR